MQGFSIFMDIINPRSSFLHIKFIQFYKQFLKDINWASHLLIILNRSICETIQLKDTSLNSPKLYINYLITVVLP